MTAHHFVDVAQELTKKEREKGKNDFYLGNDVLTGTETPRN
jgi:hypothetical protein